MDNIDLAISFDTTGSMYPCLTQVRRNVVSTIKYMFEQIPQIRIAIMAHGDYCDGSDVLSVLDFTNDENAICKFVQTVRRTDGGDCNECYEFVLNRARTLSWTSKKNKAFVLIGDADPHRVGYRHRGIVNQLDWENEAALLLNSNIAILPIQALDHANTSFYTKLASMSKSPLLTLDQFADTNHILMAIAMSRANKLVEFEKVLQQQSGISYSVFAAVDSLMGRAKRTRKTTTLSKFAVAPSRFQILHVDADCSIKDFVQANGLLFKQGQGFYEFTKTETIQSYKEVILQDVETGDMFSGDKAREIAGIPIGINTRLKPETLTRYRCFVQSTSNNRKLKANTFFLYEA